MTESTPIWQTRSYTPPEYDFKKDANGAHAFMGNFLCGVERVKHFVKTNGKKSFLSKESDTKILQSIHFAKEVGIISSYSNRLYEGPFRLIRQQPEKDKQNVDVLPPWKNICTHPCPQRSLWADSFKIGLYSVTRTWQQRFTSSYDSRRFTACGCGTQTSVAGNAARQKLLIAVSHVV